ncbi:hypothetical protein [Cytobacillus oceanisediminis]|uniref:hypothetical protein n=1 Tax=Cytobacillus oceanisediminis TaxID=665099 RepID=UPI0037360820
MAKKWDLFEGYLKCDPNIKAAEVVTDYVENYRSQAISEEVQPIIDRLEKAKADYFNSLFDLYEKEAEYMRIDRKVKDIAGVNYYIKPVVDFSDINLINEPEIVGAQVLTTRLFPTAVKREKYSYEEGAKA